MSRYWFTLVSLPPVTPTLTTPALTLGVAAIEFDHVIECAALVPKFARLKTKEAGVCLFEFP
jgi:hypothetical protein